MLYAHRDTLEPAHSLITHFKFTDQNNYISYC